jgi:lysophospholipase L1-like esterase
MIRPVSSGVVAVGDSITNACSVDLTLGGVPPLSWAQWVARTMGEDLDVYARPGATSAEIRREILPTRLPDCRLGLVFVGVNNVLSSRAWRNEDLASDVDQIAQAVRSVAQDVVVVNPSTTLGRGSVPWTAGPTVRRRVTEARQVIRAVGESRDCVVVDCPPLSGDELWIDGVHPTSLGHLRLADAVLDAIGAQRASDLDWVHAVGRTDYAAWRRRQLVLLPAVSIKRTAGWVVAR